MLFLDIIYLKFKVAGMAALWPHTKTTKPYVFFREIQMLFIGYIGIKIHRQDYRVNSYIFLIHWEKVRKKDIVCRFDTFHDIKNIVSRVYKLRLCSPVGWIVWHVIQRSNTIHDSIMFQTYFQYRAMTNRSMCMLERTHHTRIHIFWRVI